MLDFEHKKHIFFECLNNKNGSYADSIREEIEFYFDCSNNEMNFLDKFYTREEIYSFTNMLVSKIIMNEHQDGFNDIIMHYCH